MQLFYSSTSPFVRKVLIVAEEAGLRDQIELVPAVLTPVSPDPALAIHNPLGKIPALLADDGEPLFDSHVICEYLDSLRAGHRLLPASGKGRWQVLRREALADGILDAGILVRYEDVLRPEEKRWTDWREAQKRKVEQGLHDLERDCSRWREELDLGQIAVGCAIGWLEFRQVIPSIETSHPHLWSAYEKLCERESFQKTKPA